MLLPRSTRAPSRDGSFTAVGRESSFEAARALTAMRQPAVASLARRSCGAEATAPAQPPRDAAPLLPSPSLSSPRLLQQQRDRLAFMSAVMTNPTIAGGGADAAAVAALAVLAVVPPPPPPQQPRPRETQPPPQPQQQQQQRPPQASEAPLPMSPFYSQRSQLQQSAVQAALPAIFRAAAEHVRFPECEAGAAAGAAAVSPSPSSTSSPLVAAAAPLPRVVRVAEIGCSLAGNTKLPMQALLAGLGARAHRARLMAAGERRRRVREAALRERRHGPVFTEADGGAAGADAHADAAAAAAVPLPAQVELRLVDLPANDWAAVALAAQHLSAELARGTGGGASHDAAAAAPADAPHEDGNGDGDADGDESDDGEMSSEAIGHDFDDDALAAGGPLPPAAPPARVRLSLAPVSMYDSAGVAPEASLHLIYSNTCASWQPCQHAALPAGSSAAAFVSLTRALRARAADPRRAGRDGGRERDALEAWRLGAREALGRWMRLRAAELADGGVLVLNLPCADEGAGGGTRERTAGDGGDGADGGGEEEDEEEEEEANSFATWMAPLIGGAVRDLLREGAITPDEAEALAVPVCALPSEDLREVLASVGAIGLDGAGARPPAVATAAAAAAAAAAASAPAPAAAPSPALFELLESSREVLPPHPAWYHYRTGSLPAIGLGAAYGEWVGALCGPFWVAALAPRLAARSAVAAPGRGAAEAAAAGVVGLLFRRVAERVARDPRPLRYLPAVFTLRRLPRGAAA